VYLYPQHLKSKVLDRNLGTVFITKMGIRSDKDRLVFPEKKRATLRNLILLCFQGKTEFFKRFGERKEPENIVSGHIAEFLGYVAKVGTLTKSEEKLLALCKEFEQTFGNLGKDRKEGRSKP
jgi:hypothetical protein